VESAPKCPTGSVISADECVWCDAGTYQTESSCEACPVDTYQDLVGQAQCIACAGGLSTNRQSQQSQCEEDDGFIEEIEDAVAGLSTVTLAIIGAAAGVFLVIIVVVTVCIVKKTGKKAVSKVVKIQSRVSPEPNIGRENQGYLNSRTSIQHA